MKLCDDIVTLEMEEIIPQTSLCTAVITRPRNEMGWDGMGPGDYIYIDDLCMYVCMYIDVTVS